MDEMTIEKATYVVEYFSKLLTLPESLALKHSVYSSKGVIKMNDESWTKIYYEKGLLSDDAEILNYLKDGYDQFIINCANRILQDSPGEVFFNLCPVCGRLARTPGARQFRFCGFD